jgi:hypothetical protein
MLRFPMMKELAETGGWSEWFTPHPTRYREQCCDCGLIHRVEHRKVNGVIQKRARRVAATKKRK